MRTRAQSFDIGDGRTLWLGEANGETVQWVLADDTTLYVNSVMGEYCAGVQLVDEGGRIYGSSVKLINPYVGDRGWDELARISQAEVTT